MKRLTKGLENESLPVKFEKMKTFYKNYRGKRPQRLKVQPQGPEVASAKLKSAQKCRLFSLEIPDFTLLMRLSAMAFLFCED